MRGLCSGSTFIAELHMSKPSVRPMRWLILGGGAIVWQSHLPALVMLGWDEESTVVEPLESNLACLRAVGSRAVLLASGYREALAEPGLASRHDAVLIALPNSMHADAIERCIAAGLPCMCEKPLGLNAAESERLCELAARAGVPLGVAMVRRYVPSLRAAQAALAEGLIGELRSVEIAHGSRFAWPASSYYFRRENGGILLNMGVHHLDFLESTLGPLSPVRFEDDAVGGVEANCMAVLRSTSGVDVRLSLSFTHRLHNEFIWRGERGELRHAVDEFGKCCWIPADGRLTGALELTSPYRSGDWKASFSSGFVEQLYDFARSVRERTPVLVPAAVAVRTTRLIEACYAQRCGTPAWMPDASRGAAPTLAAGSAVVTGASGFVGNRLVERLQRLGVGPIVTPVRSRQTIASLARLDADIQLTNLTDLAAMRTLLRGRRYVFHLAYGSGGPGSAGFTINSTKTIVDAAIAEGCEVLVVVSTGSVFGMPVGRVTEESPYLPSLGDYGSSKAEAERYALAAAGRSESTRIVVINPSAVYGPTGPTFTEIPVRMAAAGQFFWVEDGRGNANYVYVENLVDALLLAAAAPSAHGRRYLISDGVTTWRAFLEPQLGRHAAGVLSLSLAEFQASRVQRVAGLVEIAKLATFRNPAFMAAVSAHPLLGRLKQQVVTWLPGWQRQLQQERASDWRTDFLKTSAAGRSAAPWLVDLFGPIATEYVSDRARRELGWAPRVSLAEGQKHSRAWLDYLGL